MSNEDEISKLCELRKKTVLTHDEFKQEVKRLLGVGAATVPVPQVVPAKPVYKNYSEEIQAVKETLGDIKARMEREVTKLEDSEDDWKQERASDLQDAVCQVESAIDSLNDISNC